MSTFGFGIALKELVTFIWGREPLAMSRFIGGTAPLDLVYVRILPQELAIVLLGLGVTALYVAFTRASILGTAIRAVAIDERTAGLMGIDSKRLAETAARTDHDQRAKELESDKIRLIELCAIERA